jgi:hypothetical protein
MADVARLAGIELDDTQRFLVDVIGGVDGDGGWAGSEYGIYGPRQGGKTEVLIARMLFGLFVAREKSQVFSAHEVKTASKVFRRLKLAIDRSRALGGKIKRVSNRPGSETIELTTGQILECVARSTSSGRGFTASTVLMDEAHTVDADQMAAQLPALATIANAQIIYALSFADQGSLHLAGVRERALDGKPGVGWLEHSVADDDDVEDREVWKRCNPGYWAGRIQMSAMEREFQALGPVKFAQERLGRSVWPTGEPGCWQVFSEADWLAITRDPNGDPWVFGSDVPAPAPAVPSRPFDPFEAWGPSGVPPWVSRVGL